ncbi:DUF397 domain-containing protein [Actinomadura geliboluensis]|uniref:DUF397 domain-containing protein n=1 Tax=Actinomadura geliboluensis TaxID=882440 RepID=UPI0033B097F3
MPLENVNWRRSTYSASNGGDCVELASIPDTHWRKSSHSGSNGGDCVELADVACASVVAVRDSKDPDGPVLLLTRAALRTALQSATDTH